MLNKILATKREELKVLSLPKAVDVPSVSFYDALRYPKRSSGLIAEVKKASPSRGLIKENFDPVDIAKAYETAGADAISVLTDQTYFQGHHTYLSAIKQKVNLPVIRKDFIIDPLQVEESRRIGADAILLIVGAVEMTKLYNLYRIAEEEGMDCLVEVHSQEDLESLLSVFTPKIIGINNRDLKTFQTSLSQTEKLARLVPKESIFISESGIHTFADIQAVRSYGANGVLVGESLMRASSPQQGIEALFGGEKVGTTSN